MFHVVYLSHRSLLLNPFFSTIELSNLRAQLFSGSGIVLGYLLNKNLKGTLPSSASPLLTNAVKFNLLEPLLISSTLETYP